jgi:ProP effector
MTKTKRKAVVASIAAFADRFAVASVILETRRRPLKIGIAQDIYAAAPEIDKRDLQMALAHYCKRAGYLRSMTSGAGRADLDGAAAGVVTDEAAASARVVPAQAMAARTRRAQVKHAAKIEHETKPAPTLSMSFARLREPARQRRATQA